MGILFCVCPLMFLENSGVSENYTGFPMDMVPTFKIGSGNSNFLSKNLKSKRRALFNPSMVILFVTKIFLCNYPHAIVLSES